MSVRPEPNDLIRGLIVDDQQVRRQGPVGCTATGPATEAAATPAPGKAERRRVGEVPGAGVSSARGRPKLWDEPKQLGKRQSERGRVG